MLMKYIEYNICKRRKEIRLIQDTCIRFSITVIEIKLITNVQLVSLKTQCKGNNLFVIKTSKLQHVSCKLPYNIQCI